MALMKKNKKQLMQKQRGSLDSRRDLGKISESSTYCLVANKFNTDVDNLAVRQHFMRVLDKSTKQAHTDSEMLI